jgi:hypothetical protein
MSLNAAIKSYCSLLAVTLLIFTTLAVEASAQEVCPSGGTNTLKAQPNKTNPPNLLVNGKCIVPKGRTDYFANVNIVEGGKLYFLDWNVGNITFWAASIIVEAGGSLIATGSSNGSDPDPNKQFGLSGDTLTIYLYGEDKARWDGEKFTAQNQGALCLSPSRATNGTELGPCGIPKKDIWDPNGNTDQPVKLPGQGSDDFFYQYGPLYGDARCVPNNSADKDKVWIFADGHCRENKEIRDNAKVGYFGTKVLGVSYGATVQLFGYKGVTDESKGVVEATNSGVSWMRLADGKNLEPKATSLTLERAPGVTRWRKNDEIVVTTTDYLPGHSEKLKIADNYNGGATVDFQTNEPNPDDSGKKTIRWRHNGTRYGGQADAPDKRWARRTDKPSFDGRLPYRLQASIDWGLVKNGAETRAAVALLTRSIRIVSGGNNAGDPFPEASTGYSYGGHMVIRQGFKQLQISGVEFVQMGQGGRLGHYPVHFHMARKTPYYTYVKDSSVNESMTRWFVIHSTQGVTLARNVGYKSIGHGYYLEDGTEADNNFYSNIGIFARAAVNNRQNDRKVPGILVENTDPAKIGLKYPAFPYRSDSEHPTVFWITNGWNNFIGNMAAGAGACGAAYWFVPASNRDHIEVTEDDHAFKPMKWSGYAGLQRVVVVNGKRNPDFGGTTPLKSFYKNYATSAMFSFQTTGDSADCPGIIGPHANPEPPGAPFLRGIPGNSPPPAWTTNDKGVKIPDILNDHYFPFTLSGSRYATKCAGDEAKGYDCSGVTARCDNGQLANCAVTVLDTFTSSFHWAEGNYSAIWLRPQWYLVTNSVLSDVQNGGLTFITGGDYTHASIIPGYWALAKSSVFIGNTNPLPDNNANKKFAFTSNIGPFNALSGVLCDQIKDIPSYCLSADEGISMRTNGFFTNQRLANIYDGPSYQDSNAYLDITAADCPVWNDMKTQGCMYGNPQSYLRLKRKPGNVDDYKNGLCRKEGVSYLPNAAIAWKQPNGFYYPPAFHTKNLFFGNVDLRHYVINPLFKDGTYLTDEQEVLKQYCTDVPQVFNTWTSIDRQTELTDDDGTLTGLSNNALPKGVGQETVSVNDDKFFTGPLEFPECGSALGANAQPPNSCTAPPDPAQPPSTAKTSPYEHVSTVILREKTGNDADDALWSVDCADPNCYGVPLFRQYLTKAEKADWDQNCKDSASKSSDKCRWPFIRMSGAHIRQRQTMTMSGGQYYLDTTIKKERQESEAFTTANPRSLNVFAPSQTYSMFFLYGRRTTVQTYKIYVGAGFTMDRFKVGRVNVNSDPLKFNADSTVRGISAAPVVNNILTVTIDFASAADLEPTAEELCQPRSFCKPGGINPVTNKRECSRAVTFNDPLIRANRGLDRYIESACRDWAMKDLDCPKAGCPGFSFTLPPQFATGEYKRPDPDVFPPLQTRFVRSKWWPDNEPQVPALKSCFYPYLCDPK